MAFGVVRVSLTQNFPMQKLALITSTAGTVTGPTGYGSSLFLQRLLIPAPMAISEINHAIGMAFAATNNGAGTISKSLAIYSFGNSTSLATIFTISGTSAWSTGTTTSAGATSITQFQGGWSGSVQQAFTFASSLIPAGEYVVGHIFNLAQAAAASTWSVSLFGMTADPLTSATAAALSSGGLLAGSAITGAIGSSAMANSVLALGTVGSMTGFTMSLSASTGVAASTTSGNFSAAGMNWSISNTNTSISAAIAFVSSNKGMITSVSYANTLAGSIFTASTSTTVLSAAGLAALPSFTYVGQGAGAAQLPSAFAAGVMSTGAPPASIAISNVNQTTGSAALLQPWFALIGA